MFQNLSEDCAEFYNMILGWFSSEVESRVGSNYEKPWKEILIFFSYFLKTPKLFIIFKFVVFKNISPVYAFFYWIRFLHGKTYFIKLFSVYMACLKYRGI